MRIAFCDDDPKVPALLEEYLREFFQQNGLPQPEYAVYSTGAALVDGECAQESPPLDVAFLDVEMPGLSGIQAGARLQERHPFGKIFIVTAHAGYLDDAMRFHVFRYLSKPVDKERLFRNMRDALWQLAADTRPVVIETKDGAFTRYAHEIILVEAQGRQVLVRAADGVYASTQGMKHWEKLLEIGSFTRTHRSYIVNMRYVRAYTSALITLEIPGGGSCTAYLARRRVQEFRDSYLLYMEAMR